MFDTFENCLALARPELLHLRRHLARPELLHIKTLFLYVLIVILAIMYIKGKLLHI